MTPSIPIFRNEINALGNFREGVNISSEFTPFTGIQASRCHFAFVIKSGTSKEDVPHADVVLYFVGNP